MSDNKTISLTDKQAEELKIFVEEKIQELNKEIRKYQKIYHQLTSVGRKKGFTYSNIVLDILEDHGDFMTTRDVYKEVIKRHPETKQRKRKSLISTISATLSLHVESGKVSKENTGQYQYGQNSWGLSKWKQNPELLS